MARWGLWCGVWVFLVPGCFRAIETERLELITLCTDICKQAVDEAIYAEGTSVLVATSNLRCRCYFKKQDIIAIPEPVPTPTPTPRR